jgi:hypothetical protein
MRLMTFGAILMAAIVGGGCGKSARHGSNETSAIGTLRSITTAQEQFRMQKMVDQDGDGKAEYGYVTELAGVLATRSGESAKGKPFIRPSIGNAVRAGGIAENSGYYFIVYLPTAKGPANPEAGDGRPGSASAPDADAQEKRWCAYAWPVVRGSTGTRAFWVSQAQEVYASDNEVQQYSGTQKLPGPGAAMRVDGKNSPNLDSSIALAGSTDPTSKGGDWIQPKVAAGDGGLWFPAGG